MGKQKPKRGVSPQAHAALTTFSDLMSLLLTLFVLLYALSEPKRPKLEATLSAIRQQMQKLPPPPPPRPAIRPPQATPAEMNLLRQGPPGKRPEVTTLVEDGRQKVVIGGEGLFQVGSAALSAGAKRILQYDVVPNLAGFYNRVEIIGYADREEATASENAWSLAGRRANAVMEFLVDECGIDGRRFRLINCGDNEPRSPDNPALNRRVEVIMTDTLINSGDLH